MATAANPRDAKSQSLWYQDAIIYETHVRAFFDSDADGVGDFRGLTEKIDYLHDLGITAIWLLPFYPSPLKDDGYDIADYFGIHPSYGTLNDFRTFLEEAHRRGLRVITELVVNHTSDQHPWFQRARRAPVGSPERDFYVWTDDPTTYAETRIIFTDTEASNWTYDPVAGQYFWHRFYSHQPDLNYDNPAVRRAIFDVVDYWLDMGVDGLRLDAVPYLIERPGTDCENLPETHQILKELRRHIDDNYTDRMLLAEANQWPDDAVAYFGDGDECHMCFHFPLMPRLYMAIQTEDRFPIIDILAQTPDIPDSSQWALFLRNHDELTLEMVTDEERIYMYRSFAQAPEARINLGIRRRLAPLLGNSRRRIELMNALLFSMPGTPVLYYGDEIGMGDNVYLGDRNGVRTPMQWSDDRHAGFSRAQPQRLYLPLISDHEYHYETVHVEVQEHNRHSLLWWMRGLISRRKRHKAFGRGTLEFLNPANRRVLAFVRRFEDEQILVVANLSRFVQPVELDLSEFRGLVPVEMVGRTEFWRIDDTPYHLTLGPHSFYWFSIEPQRVETRIPTRTGVAEPVLVGQGTWDAVVNGEARGDLEQILPAYLRTQRWFAGRARRVLSTRIIDAFPVPADDPQAYFTTIGVAYADGDPELYALPLAFAPDTEAGEWNGPAPARVARLRIAGENGTVEGVLFDALWQERLATAILEAMVDGRPLDGDRGLVTSTRLPDAANPPTSENIAGLHPGFADEDQSNSSVRFGDQYILKVFRRLDDGINPELEVGAFLLDHEFPHAAPLAGALEYHRSRSGTITLATLHHLVPHRGNAWQAAQEGLTAFHRRVLTPGSAAPNIASPNASAMLHLAGQEPPPLLSEQIGPFLETTRFIGRRVAELHLALATASVEPAFVPVHFSPFTQRALYQAVRGLTGRTMRELRRDLPLLSEETRLRATELLELQTGILERFKALLNHKVSAVVTRIHGDLHLEQLLVVDGDVMLIDFEGEPGSAVEERRLKRSPLRDVASMLRSFQYAAAVAQRRHLGDLALSDPDARSAQEAWMRHWFVWTSATFLRAYLDTAGEAPFLPIDNQQLADLLDTFMIERALYELGYDLRNRPERAGIAIDGILEWMAAQPVPGLTPA